MVARQNGKGGILEARELAGLFLFGERRIIHSAHLFETSMDHFERLLDRIESNPETKKRIKRVSRSHGDESITLKSGEKIKFKTRTKGGGRGLSGDLVVLDEAMELPSAVMSALRPVMRATPNHQLWMTGSAVDQTIHAHGLEFARARHRAKHGLDPTGAWFEWTADEEAYAADPSSVADEVEQWLRSNPGLGIRIELETMAGEHRKMDRRGFAVELLSVGDWPDVAEDLGEDGGPLDYETWSGLQDPASKHQGPVVLGVAVSQDRKWTSISAVGWRADRRLLAELIERRSGVRWSVDRIVELVEKHDVAAVAVDGRAGMADQLEEALGEDVPVMVTSSSDMAAACAALVDEVNEGRIVHLGQDDLDDPVREHGVRRLAGAFAWTQGPTGVDVTPLESTTLAVWGRLQVTEEQETPSVMFL